MFRDFLAFVARLTPARVLLLGLFCAVMIEATTVVLRFGLDLQSTRDTAVIGTYSWGMRVHHGYLALPVAAAALCLRERGLRKLLLILAVGLFVSDLFHHFLVLWPLTGSPQFDLFYPAPPPLPLPG
jgi:hypothetical protein